MRRSHPFFPLLVLAFLTLALSFEASATITVTDVRGASNTENVNVTNDTSLQIVIYGGTAGSLVGDFDGGCGAGHITTTSTCNNCVDDASLPVCNETRIHTNLELIIQFISDSSSGTPRVTKSDGTTQITHEANATSVAAGEPAEVIIKWGNLCGSLSSGNTNCEDPAGISDSIRVGIDTDGDGDIDDAKTVSIKVQQAIGATHSPQCDGSTPNDGICYFELVAGDKKATITTVDVVPGGGYPVTANGLNFNRVRFLYSDVGFASITPLSPHQDITVEVGDLNDPVLNSRKITGLTNGVTYFFKIANIDQAGNIGLYTPTTAVCDATADQTCMMATPGEVLGVLAEDQNCFIATASYGSLMAPKVQTFRDFRNAYLLRTMWGQKFVRLYYKYSPAIASIIADSEPLQQLSRAFLWPLWLFAFLSLKLGAMNTTLLFATILCLPLLLWRRQQLQMAKQKVRVQK